MVCKTVGSKKNEQKVISFHRALSWYSFKLWGLPTSNWNCCSFTTWGGSLLTTGGVSIWGVSLLFTTSSKSTSSVAGGGCGGEGTSPPTDFRGLSIYGIKFNTLIIHTHTCTHTHTHAHTHTHTGKPTHTHTTHMCDFKDGFSIGRLRCVWCQHEG